jgi:hypothetical protein
VRVRIAILTLTCAFAACAKPAPEVAAPKPAEDPFAVWPPRMPAGIDLDVVPLGRWAQYEESYLGAATIKERVALVAKGADGNTIETTTEMGGGDRTVFGTTFAGGIGGGAQLVKNVFQVSDDEPMEAPPAAPGQQPYPPVDPKTLVGIDTISTRAGTFRAKHHRERTAYGEQVDFWIDDTVGPIGLVKLEAEQKQHPTVRAGFTFELVAAGNDAIPQITRSRGPPAPSIRRC